MSEQHQHETAILIGVEQQNDRNFTYSMQELANLAEACEVTVAGQLTQKLTRINPSHYVGKGKIEEITALIAEKEANLVIFNDELSPSQLRNLEEELECKVIDRTILILDIFQKRAKTREAQLQVEIADLQYRLPRLVGLGESLGRQGGGVGTTNRGSGEKKIELDRRRIEDKISALSKELEDLTAHRRTQRKQRTKTQIPTVSLVGYTNAGKSTTMNALLKQHGHEEKHVLEKNMLFATVETSVRHIALPDNKSFLLADTVGFVDKLPHHLIKAFRSTLEEVIESDLLIHIIDASNPEHQTQQETTEKTLESIGVKNIPTIYVYNKTDLANQPAPTGQNTIHISAKTGQGLDQLIKAIKQHIYADYITCTMLIPYHQGHIVSHLNETATILQTEYEEQGTRLKIECKQADYERYRQYVL